MCVPVQVMGHDAVSINTSIQMIIKKGQLNKLVPLKTTFCPYFKYGQSRGWGGMDTLWNF